MSFEPFQPQYGTGVVLACSTTSAATTITGTKVQSFVVTNTSDVFVYVKLESLASGATAAAATTADYCLAPNGGQVTLKAKDLFGRNIFSLSGLAASGSSKNVHIIAGSGF